MCNWKEDLWRSVAHKDSFKLDFILSLDNVKSALPNVKQWKPYEDPVHEAAALGCDNMLRKLLEHGANPNAYKVWDNGDKYLPIHFAVLKQNISLVQLLIQFGADPTLKSNYYLTGKLLKITLTIISLHNLFS